MFTLHHLERSRSQRVLWLLEELGLPYELVVHRRDPKTFLAPEALQRVHPLGKSPVLVDEERVVAESAAILEYLGERHGAQLVPPKESADFLRYRYFMHYAEGSLMPPLLVKFIFHRVQQAPLPFFVKPIVRLIANGVGAQFVEPNLRRHIDFLETELERSTWFAGESLSLADIQMSYPVEMLLLRAPEAQERPRLRAFVERVRARPAYQRAIARGGPVDPT